MERTKPSVKIAVAYHKEAPLLEGNIYIPIQVGKANHPEIDLNIQPDNEGDNISKDNFSMCELTATYWIWKNVKADYKGLFHYRRILSCKNYKKSFINCLRALKSKQSIYQTVQQLSLNNFLQETQNFELEVFPLLYQYDILTIRASRLPYSTELFHSGLKKHLNISKEIIKDKFPEYIAITEEALLSNTMFFCNMLIMNSTLFDSYCEFIFGILLELKKRMTDLGYFINPDKELIFERQLGYVGEVLTNIFINKNISEGKKIKELTCLTY